MKFGKNGAIQSRSRNHIDGTVLIESRFLEQTFSSRNLPKNEKKMFIRV